MNHEVHRLGGTVGKPGAVAVVRYPTRHVIISKDGECITLTFEEASNLAQWLEAT